MQERNPDQFAFSFRLGFLEALAAENIEGVEVVHVVLHSTDPAELILALRTDYVIATSLFLLDNDSTPWAVHHRFLVVSLGEELLHSDVQLGFAVLPLVVCQAALHADLVTAVLTLAMEHVPPRKDTVRSLLDVD